MGGETLEQVPQRKCGCPITESVQGQVRLSFKQPVAGGVGWVMWGCSQSMAVPLCHSLLLMFLPCSGVGPPWSELPLHRSQENPCPGAPPPPPSSPSATLLLTGLFLSLFFPLCSARQGFALFKTPSPRCNPTTAEGLSHVLWWGHRNSESPHSLPCQHLTTDSQYRCNPDNDQFFCTVTIEKKIKIISGDSPSDFSAWSVVVFFNNHVLLLRWSFICGSFTVSKIQLVIQKEK